LGADTPNQFVPWHKWNIIAATISFGKNSISNMHYRKSIYHQKHKKERMGQQTDDFPDILKYTDTFPSNPY